MTTEHDSRNLPAVTAKGECTACGRTGLFILAVDSTTYTPGITFEDGKPVVDKYTETQPSDAEDSVRFYCGGCGERHQVPAELLE
jgi:hypothetical protein